MGTHQTVTVRARPSSSATAMAVSCGSGAARARHLPVPLTSIEAEALASCSDGSSCPGKNRLSAATLIAGCGTGGCIAALKSAHCSAHSDLQRDVLAHPWKYSNG